MVRDILCIHRKWLGVWWAMVEKTVDAATVHYLNRTADEIHHHHHH